MNKVVNAITKKIIQAVTQVHNELGPGMLESTYQTCLVRELQELGLEVKTQVALPVCYRGETIDGAYQVDLLVNEAVLLELETVDRLEPIHKERLFNYLRCSGLPVGLLINFNVTAIKQGIKRLVNEGDESSPPAWSAA